MPRTDTRSLIFLIFVIAFGCTKTTEYEYFSEGKVSRKVEMVNGVRNGLLEQYYKNGVIESQQEWANGKLNGRFTDYYPEGIIWRRGNYRDSKRFGTWTYYYKDGTIFQIQKYDSLGDIEDIERYLSDGRRDVRPFPYVYINSPVFGDTLESGKRNVLVVKIVNISDSTLSAGELILADSLKQSESGRITVVDTIAVVRPQPFSFDYRFDFAMAEQGEGVFLGLVHCEKDQGKEVKIIAMGFNYPFFVRKGPLDDAILHRMRNEMTDIEPGDSFEGH